ncbi:MAG: hypothetical protein GYB41_05495 [Oceanospirillales bacterium]|nr:hypothetical protein [Oceanospirillales bacterium]
MKKHTLKNIGELEALYMGLKSQHKLDDFYYDETFFIDHKGFMKLDFYELDFKPYVDISNIVGSSCFGLWKSKIRIYLGHINNAGHGARYMVRAVTLCQVKDVQLMENLKSNYCEFLEKNAVQGLPYEL